MKDLAFINFSSGTVPVNPDDNDIEIDPVTGDFVVYEGHMRVIQRVIKIFLTQVGSNPLIPGYGTLVSTLIGKRDFDQVKQRLSDSLSQAMGFLQAVEDSQRPDERIRAFSLSVLKDKVALYVKISVTFEDGTTFAPTIPIILPSANFRNVGIAGFPILEKV